MVSYMLSKDKRIRAKISGVEFNKLRFQFFLKSSQFLSSKKLRMKLFFYRNFGSSLRYSVRNRNRCLLTGRAGSVFRFFRMSRITLKNFSSNGQLTGVRKSSW